MNMRQYLHRVRSSVTKLPDKKQYVELITATLTVPVLATAIILNFNNLKSKSSTPETTPSTVQEKIIYISPNEKSSIQTTSSECIKGIAPLSISSPTEGETVTDNPVYITISYTQGEYCSSVWSYRINNGKWSEYDDKSIALYNLSSGTIRFDLKAKSLVDKSEKTYSRTFTYKGENNQLTPSLTESSSSSSSAN